MEKLSAIKNYFKKNGFQLVNYGIDISKMQSWKLSTNFYTKKKSEEKSMN